MYFKIFRRKKHFLSFGERLKKFLESVVKGMVFLLKPAAVASGVTFGIWHELLYKHGIHLNDKLEAIATSAWLPLFGVPYGLILATIALPTVWDKYNKMRMAWKRRDFGMFMELRDEELSPLIHLTLAVLSGGMLAGFLALDYHDHASGAIVVFSTSFLVSFMYFVVDEIDHPCSGIWFIKNVSEEWLAKDPKEWRAEKEAGEVRKKPPCAGTD